MNYSDLFSKLEQAGVALVLQKAPTVPAITGQSNQDKPAPLVICYAENAGEEDPPDSGNFWANFQIEAKYPAPIDADGIDTKPANDLMVSTAFDVFMSATLAADLNGAGIQDFTALGVRTRNTGFHVEGDMWINILTLQILCCPTSLYP